MLARYFGAALSSQRDLQAEVQVRGGKVQLGAVTITVKWIGAFTDGHKKILSIENEIGGKVVLDDDSEFENPARHTAPEMEESMAQEASAGGYCTGRMCTKKELVAWAKDKGTALESPLGVSSRLLVSNIRGDLLWETQSVFACTGDALLPVLRRRPDTRKKTREGEPPPFKFAQCSGCDARKVLASTRPGKHDHSLAKCYPARLQGLVKILEIEMRFLTSYMHSYEPLKDFGTDGQPLTCPQMIDRVDKARNTVLEIFEKLWATLMFGLWIDMLRRTSWHMAMDHFLDRVMETPRCSIEFTTEVFENNHKDNRDFVRGSVFIGFKQADGQVKSVYEQCIVKANSEKIAGVRFAQGQRVRSDMKKQECKRRKERPYKRVLLNCHNLAQEAHRLSCDQTSDTHHVIKIAKDGQCTREIVTGQECTHACMCTHGSMHAQQHTQQHAHLHTQQHMWVNGQAPWAPICKWKTGWDACPHRWTLQHTRSPSASLRCLNRMTTKGMCTRNTDAHGRVPTNEQDVTCPGSMKPIADAHKTQRGGLRTSQEALEKCCRTVVVRITGRCVGNTDAINEPDVDCEGQGRERKRPNDPSSKTREGHHPHSEKAVEACCKKKKAAKRTARDARQERPPPNAEGQQEAAAADPGSGSSEGIEPLQDEDADEYADQDVDPDADPDSGGGDGNEATHENDDKLDGSDDEDDAQEEQRCQVACEDEDEQDDNDQGDDCDFDEQ